MANALYLIGYTINSWWEFMWDNDVPGTSFSFGALYMFVLVIGIFTFLASLISHRKDEDK